LGLDRPPFGIRRVNPPAALMVESLEQIRVHLRNPRLEVQT
jgi:hypothetical protein